METVLIKEDQGDISKICIKNFSAMTKIYRNDQNNIVCDKIQFKTHNSSKECPLGIGYMKNIGTGKVKMNQYQIFTILASMIIISLLTKSSARDINLLSYSRKLDENSSTLFYCSSYTTCMDCMRHSACIWDDGGCKDSSVVKTLSQYAQCKDIKAMPNFCVNYYGENPMPIYDGLFLEHKLINGYTQAASYCRWTLQLINGLNTRINISRKLNGIDLVQIKVIGKGGQVVTLTDPTAGSYSTDMYISSSALSFDPDKLIVEAVYILSSYSEEYKITFYQYSIETKSSSTIVVVVTLIGCFSIVICSCFVIVIRVLLKRNSFINILNQQANTQHHNEIRLKKLLNEIQSVDFKLETVEFSQTSCIVCLENFTQESKIRIMPECKHIFHTNCIDTWLRSKLQQELRCAHCNIIIKTQQELNQLQKLKIEKIEADNIQIEDKSEEIHEDINQSDLIIDANNSNRLCNNFYHLSQNIDSFSRHSKNDKKSKHYRRRLDDLPEISSDKEDLNNSCNKERSKRYIIPSYSKVVSSKMILTEETKTRSTITKQIKIEVENMNDYEDSMVDLSSSKLIADFKYLAREEN